MNLLRVLAGALWMSAMVQAEVIEIASLKELAEYAAQSGNTVRMKPGVYRMTDYLTDEVIAEIRSQVPQTGGRPPVWMIQFSGNDNHFEMRDVILEIDTSLYPKLPRGYARLVFVSGNNITIAGLTIRNTGPQRGSHGNTLSVWGQGNTLENVTVYVSGSQPYGYGDLFGKGGPNLTGLQKQSGIMVAGQNNTLRRCKVISRAFGHCFYIQNAGQGRTENILLEDCYAEGVMRSTNDMLRETSGIAFDLNFRSVYENRDGRFAITPGYMKALCEDGFRTYGGTGKITLRNCIAINTRAGFEIAGPNDGEEKTIIEGAVAMGCERAYLIGSNTVIRNSRGDIRYGPLLYLRGGQNSDIELELTGEGSDYTVHALATIAGQGHRVRFFTHERDRPVPAVPIMLGFGMPAHAEMASPILPAEAAQVTLINEIPRMTVILSDKAVDCQVTSPGPVVPDDATRNIRDARGAWPTGGVAQ